MMQANSAQENPELDIRNEIPVFGWYETGLALNQAALDNQRKKYARQVADALKEKGLLKERMGIDTSLPASITSFLVALL
jgi:hypothetical protein